MIIYILLAWIVIGLASGLITDYVTEEDTRLKDLFAYSVFGPVTTVFGLLMIYNDKLKKKIDWLMEKMM